MIGVSHLKIQTIADRLGKSVRTIKNHIKYLKENGFITVINTTRVKSGGKGANTYVINPIEVQQNIIYCTSKPARRKQDRKRNEHQSQQAMAYVQVKKETISFLKLLNSFKRNKGRKKQIKLKRIENIKNFRTCPEGVPIEIYKQYKYFFSDDQIQCLFNKITEQMNQYSNINDDQYTDIINNTFNSLIKALKKQHRGIGKPIRNIFEYAIGAAKKQAFNTQHMNKWLKFWSSDAYLEPEDNDIQQDKASMHENTGFVDEEGVPY